MMSLPNPSFLRTVLMRRHPIQLVTPALSRGPAVLPIPRFEQSDDGPGAGAPSAAKAKLDPGSRPGDGPGGSSASRHWLGSALMGLQTTSSPLTSPPGLRQAQAGRIQGNPSRPTASELHRRPARVGSAAKKLANGGRKGDHRMIFGRVKSLDAILATAEKKSLNRTLGWFQLMLFGIGCVIGGGIFVLTSVGAQKAGPGLMLAFAIAGVICIVGRALLCGDRVDDPRGRFGLHLHLHRPRRDPRLDGGLGAGAGIRCRRQCRGGQLVGLFQRHHPQTVPRGPVAAVPRERPVGSRRRSRRFSSTCRR